LKGGDGHDTYLYNSGDGLDRIDDTQGGNAVLFDQRLLQGGIKRSGETAYKSLDGKLTYTWDGIAGHDLMVSGTTGAFTIQGFVNGQMGMRLMKEVNCVNGLQALAWERMSA
jgi:hypothetical protein